MNPTPNNDERLMAESIKNSKPVENIVIQRLNNAGSPSSTMIMKIPPTVMEHNIIYELLLRLRQDYPGAWVQVQHWERQNCPGPITVTERYPGQLAGFEGIKEVTREHLGLPADEPIGDIPA